MAYKVLYRKYRPSFFDDVYGQDSIVKTIKTALKNGTVSHAYLFSGPRGTGKTTVAKLIAKTVNCANYPTGDPCGECNNCKNPDNVDIIEIDAASNNGVDEIRELKSKVSLVPTNSKYKVYIIDEVHMLSTGAFNALLKTLEEPPHHVIFILATTEPYKIPNTIISRCQRFDFKRINDDKIVERLDNICKKEKVKVPKEVLEEIAEISDGGMRDAISLLDQVLVYNDGNIDVGDVHRINGTLTKKEIDEFVLGVFKNDIENTVMRINDFNAMGKNFTKLVDEFIFYFKDLLLDIVTKSNGMTSVSQLVSEDFVYKILDEFLELKNRINSSSYEKLLFEISVLKMFKKEEKEFPIEIKVEEPVVEVKEKLSDDTFKEINKLKVIRVNNTLADADKKEKEKLFQSWLDLPTYATKKKYSKACGLLLDGSIMAASPTHLIISYPALSMANRVNVSLSCVQELLNKLTEVDYKIIAVTDDEWAEIKKEYMDKINKKEKYKMMKENIDVNDLEKTVKKNIVDKNVKNAIDLFGEDFIEVK